MLTWADPIRDFIPNQPIVLRAEDKYVNVQWRTDIQHQAASMQHFADQTPAGPVGRERV